MQKVQVNKLAALDFAKRALKRATKWYAREKNKPGGLLSYQIAQRVRNKYNSIGLHAATILCYISTNLAGMSLLKIWVKGDVPASVFKSLCMAFENFIWIQQINSCEAEITYKKLLLQINTMLRHDYWQKMLQCILSATANSLDALTMHIAKDR